MANVLITGAAGFIGSHLADRCADAGHSVFALVEPATSLHRLASSASRTEVLRADFGDRKAFTVCLEAAKPDYLFHLATRTRRSAQPELADAFQSVEEDLLNLLAILRWAATTSRPPRVVVRTGSLAEYGARPGPATETQRETPTTSYAASLVAGTHFSQMLRHRLPFALVTARLALVYGPRQSEKFLIPALINQCLDGRPGRIHRERDRRDLLYVDDAVSALLTLATRTPAGDGLFNISTGIAPTVREIAELIIAYTGSDPGLLEFQHRDDPEAIPDFRADPGHMAAATGWRARMPYDEGLQNTVAWFRDHRRRGQEA